MLENEKMTFTDAIKKHLEPIMKESLNENERRNEDIDVARRVILQNTSNVLINLLEEDIRNVNGKTIGKILLEKMNKYKKDNPDVRDAINKMRNTIEYTKNNNPQKLEKLEEPIKLGQGESSLYLGTIKDILILNKIDAWTPEGLKAKFLAQKKTLSVKEPDGKEKEKGEVKRGGRSI